MHTAIAERHGIDVTDQCQQIIGIEHGVLSNLLQALGSLAPDVAIRTEQDTRVAEKRADPANRLRPIVFEAIGSLLITHDQR